jgi:hypothetical protein
MAQYRVLSGETLWDVAAKLYSGDTALGIQDLLSLNPTIDLDLDDLYGSILTYSAGISRKKEVKPATVERSPQNIYSTRELQNVWDLSIQLYGDVSKIGKLLELFPNLDNLIPVGSQIDLEEQDDPMAIYFSDRKIIVATDNPIPPIPTEDHFRIIDTAEVRKTNTGDLRIYV